ncbi:hypothetical protein V494_06946 [Pseudogymnoascus sp. VKM F-4513 (FW-928)]|nr:hypothetical protein V494_06946 [Pseudogymnoascus sp. VKM F-4513 (FW-928)]
MAAATNDSSKKEFNFITFQNVINGELKTTPTTRHAISPINKKPLAEVPLSTAQDVDDAVAAARAAFQTWKKTSFEERAKGLNGLAATIYEYQQEFIKLNGYELGAPVSIAEILVHMGAGWLSETAKLQPKDEVVEDTPEREVVVRYLPLGVAVGIVPWNLPLHCTAAKIAAAIIAGNCIIIKPSPYTPYSGLKLVEMAQKFFPPGVVQILSGDDSLGQLLTEHPGVDKISFTGSTATGKRVMASASKSLKRITLELGGNDAAIITKNIDVATIAPALAGVIFSNSSQVCLAIKRLYVHESIFEEFRDSLVAAVKAFKLGEGVGEGENDPTVNIGPVQNEMQYNRIKGFFDDIEKEGWKVAVGGKIEESPGYFINPTIIDRPKEDSRIVVEEPFGPILPILSWSDEDDVISRANNTRMGLGASVWTNDKVEARRIAEQIEAGSVWINSHMEVNPNYPFGGHKDSGIGYENGLGGVKAFCNVQTLYLKK